MWNKVVEKAGDVEAKANLQPHFYVREINARYLKGHHPLVKKNKEDTYWEHCNEASKDKEKAKSYNTSSANQPQTQAPKKDQCSRRRGYPVTGVITTKIAKKDKDKAKDLSHVKCYTCKQKVHYANKCPEKLKN